jgi:hypothetical protein
VHTTHASTLQPGRKETIVKCTISRAIVVALAALLNAGCGSKSEARDDRASAWDDEQSDDDGSDDDSADDASRLGDAGEPDDSADTDDGDIDDDSTEDDDARDEAAEDEPARDAGAEDDDATEDAGSDSQPDEHADDGPDLSGACELIASIPTDGEASVQPLDGNDQLGFQVDGERAELRVASTGVGGAGLSVVLRAAQGEIDVDGAEVCISLTNLVFLYGLETPQVGEQLDYDYDGEADSDILTEAYPVRFFVDVNEEMSAAGNTDVDYMGTEGSYVFTEVNGVDPVDPDGGIHSVEFDVIFSPVDDGELDDSVRTRVTGRFTFNTLRRL